ncbi:PDR/VanB family oxidoreductase [Pandoraea sp. PE-S2R-1]|uniref:PDR/VanB family oxidoreductase n=1 Tax=Pandoraea sp. PE-S2R-1 TaxID=1986994 RepID=UPI000B402217|nr:PDR/VanB family oxidoreductase [Pandoraea sp. PE-S2R-1]
MEQLKVVIKRRRQETDAVVSLELADPKGRTLPAFTAGAHIDVQVERGLTRQYSLYNSPDERHRYCIAVLKEAQGRGGSRRIHDSLEVGDSLVIGAPRNAFALVEDGAHTVLMAGGIGITPTLAMAQRLDALGQSFELHYFARSCQNAPFVDWLAQSPFAAHVHCHFDDESAASPFDVAAHLRTWVSSSAHLYLCGPVGFMTYVEAASAACGWPASRFHQESFSPPVHDSQDDKAFRVVLARRGLTIDVGADQSILSALQQHGVDVPVSCEQGVCGVCLTNVLDGEPDHRDCFLTDAEHRANRQITVCCSRARTETLTLDL